MLKYDGGHRSVIADACELRNLRSAGQRLSPQQEAMLGFSGQEDQARQQNQEPAYQPPGIERTVSGAEEIEEKNKTLRTTHSVRART